jgi:hypothetical protein
MVSKGEQFHTESVKEVEGAGVFSGRAVTIVLSQNYAGKSVCGGGLTSATYSGKKGPGRGFVS